MALRDFNCWVSVAMCSVCCLYFDSLAFKAYLMTNDSLAMSASFYNRASLVLRVCLSFYTSLFKLSTSSLYFVSV